MGYKGFIFASLLSALCAVLPSHAMERVVGASHVGELTVVRQEVQTLRRVIHRINDDLENHRFCNSQGMFYAPTHPQADTDGCVDVLANVPTCPSGYVLTRGQSGIFCVQNGTGGGTTTVNNQGDTYNNTYPTQTGGATLINVSNSATATATGKNASASASSNTSIQTSNNGGFCWMWSGGRMVNRCE